MITIRMKELEKYFKTLEKLVNEPNKLVEKLGKISNKYSVPVFMLIKFSENITFMAIYGEGTNVKKAYLVSENGQFTSNNKLAKEIKKRFNNNLSFADIEDLINELYRSYNYAILIDVDK